MKLSKITHATINLNRSKQESIIIQTSDGIIQITSLREGQTNIAIKAPRNVAVDREELYDAKRETEAELKKLLSS